MASSLRLHGVYVPLITPFTDDDEVAYDAIESLANDYLDAGAAGIVALGTTGEPATLDAAEKRQIVERLSVLCRRRGAPFVVGAGTNNTRGSVAEIEALADLEHLSAVLSVVPYYTRPSEAGIVEHFKAIAKASSVPVVAYNIPYRTGRALGADSLLALAAVDNIAGLKQAVGGIDGDTLTLMARRPQDFDVLSGDDAFLFSLLTLGGSGAIAASAHLCTASFVALVDAAAKGEWAEARRLHNALLPLCSALFLEPSPALVKGVLAARGRIPTKKLRAPMTVASVAAIDNVLVALTSAEQELAAFRDDS